MVAKTVDDLGIATHKELETSNDFGFTTFDDEPAVVETEAEEDTRAEEMLEAILPLLKSLRKNPEHENIKWPNRLPQIDAFEEKLRNIVKGN